MEQFKLEHFRTNSTDRPLRHQSSYKTQWYNNWDDDTPRSFKALKFKRPHIAVQGRSFSAQESFEGWKEMPIQQIKSDCSIMPKNYEAELNAAFESTQIRTPRYLPLTPLDNQDNRRYSPRQPRRNAYESVSPSQERIQRKQKNSGISRSHSTTNSDPKSPGSPHRRLPSVGNNLGTFGNFLHPESGHASLASSGNASPANYNSSEMSFIDDSIEPNKDELANGRRRLFQKNNLQWRSMGQCDSQLSSKDLSSRLKNEVFQTKLKPDDTAGFSTSIDCLATNSTPKTQKKEKKTLRADSTNSENAQKRFNSVEEDPKVHSSVSCHNLTQNSPSTNLLRTTPPKKKKSFEQIISFCMENAKGSDISARVFSRMAHKRDDFSLFCANLSTENWNAFVSQFRDFLMNVIKNLQNAEKPTDVIEAWSELAELMFSNIRDGYYQQIRFLRRNTQCYNSLFGQSSDHSIDPNEIPSPNNGNLTTAN